MRKIAEIRKDLSAKVEATKAMDRKADEAAFRAAMDEINALREELNDAIALEAAEQAAAARQLNVMEEANKRRFSITKFLREAAEGKMTGLEAEVAEMGAKEYDRIGLSRKGFVIPMAALRASAGQNATTNADGGYMKEEQAPGYLEGLKNRLVITKLGAHVLNDLVGTVPFVSAGAISSQWVTEGTTATVSKSTISRVSLTPHRNATVAAFSKDLLRQTSLDVDAASLPVSSPPPASVTSLSARRAVLSPGQRLWPWRPRSTPRMPTAASSATLPTPRWLAS